MTGAAAAMAGLAGSAASFTVSISPGGVFGSYHGSSALPQNITTGVALAIASGGRAPYTYAYSQVGASPDTWTINSPATASTTFTGQSIGSGATGDADFMVTVTDANGIVRTAQVHTRVTNASTA